MITKRRKIVVFVVLSGIIILVSSLWNSNNYYETLRFNIQIHPNRIKDSLFNIKAKLSSVFNLNAGQGQTHEYEHALSEDFEKCQVANLDLNEHTFSKILTKDNIARAYETSCLPSSWKLFDFDYHSKLILLKPNQTFFWSSTTCCYKPFHRKKDANNVVIEYKNCTPITSDKMRLPPEHEFIHVQCWTKDTNAKKKVLIYSDLLGFVPLKPAVEKRISEYENKIKSKESENKNVNVVILGLDAVSKSNFLRYLPDTHKYIMNNLSGIEFPKYHRTSQFSFDNIVGFMMGMTRNEVVTSCWPNSTAYLDTCPLIWKEFAAKGFRTSLSEDASYWSLFYYRGDCEGFKKQPTDYDYRVLTRRMENHPGFRGEPSSKVCYGSKFNHEVIIDNVIRTAVTLKDKLYFQLSWICAMTHNVPIMTKNIGNSLIKMFEDMQEHKLINNTVFFLIADHGMNFGKPANTIQGSLEANFPMFYMIFPKWFSTKYPRAMENLKRNSELLTSHFDSYETLKDFVDLSSITDTALMKREQNKSYQSKRGISFFLPIPKDRDCQSAGLTATYCSCWTLKDVASDHYLVQESKEVLLEYFNKKLTSHRECEKAINFADLEYSMCTVPSMENLTVSIQDYDIVRVEPQCELRFKVPSEDITSIVASVVKINGTWGLTDMKFKEPSGENYSCDNVSLNSLQLNTFCACQLNKSSKMTIKLPNVPHTKLKRKLESVDQGTIEIKI